MPLIVNSAARRLEYMLGNRVVFVVPLNGGKVDDVDEDQVFTADQALLDLAERWLSGDEAAGDELEQKLDVANQFLTAQEARQNNTKQSARVGSASNLTGAADQGQQTTGGLLPSPTQLAAQVDVLSDALSLEDARVKQAQKIDSLVREAQRRNVPIDIKGLIGNPQNGVEGRFGNIGAISEAAATNPDYLRIFGGIANLAGVTEIRRIDNILAGVADQLEQQDRDQSIHDRVSQYQQALDDLEFERQEMLLDPSGTDENARVKMDAFERRYQRDYARLKQEQEKEIEKIRPGYGAWQQQGAQEAINRMPEGQRHLYNAATARFMPGMKLELQPTDRTDPNNPDQKQPMLAPPPAMQPFTAQPGQPSMATPQADQPPYPAPAGQHWVKENGTWMLRPDERVSDVGGMGGAGSFSGSAIGSLPGFASGGMFGGGAFSGGTAAGWQPPPTAGMAPGTGQPTGYNHPSSMGADRLPLNQSQEFQEALQEIARGVEEERQALIDMHRQRMALLVTERGLGPMSMPAQVEGGYSTGQPGMANVGGV